MKYSFPGLSVGYVSLFLLILPASLAAADLTDFSLEQLMAIEITSVAKKSQRLSEAAAAVHVITRDDIRRSGMTRVPELLRMVPGLHVARVDAGRWAISARGFNGVRTDKLLVLVDGRSVYTPLFSGVYWDEQDMVLEDIERIEVIRGPGGTLWGANAVNGVINIITRHSRDTQGTLVSGHLGDQERGTTARYGGRLGDNGWFRAFAKLSTTDDHPRADDEDAHDAWDARRTGFRADWELDGRDSLSLQGEAFASDNDQSIFVTPGVGSPVRVVDDTVRVDGGHLLFRWHRALSSQSDWSLQAYFDRDRRRDVTLDFQIDTWDLDFQHRFPLLDRHEITWGAGYRLVKDDIDNTFTVQFLPASRSSDLFSAFIQDEIRLRDDLRLTLGSKFEHNDYTGFEYQPSARLIWLVSERHSLWGAVSRAVRTPSRANHDFRVNFTSIPGPPAPSLLASVANSDFESEELLAFELGYRGQLTSSLALDATAYYFDYRNLATFENGTAFEATPPPAHLLIFNQIDNQMRGESFGLELAAEWNPSAAWRLRTAYTWQVTDVRLDSASTDTTTLFARESIRPEHQFQVHLGWKAAVDVEIDAALYHTSGFKGRLLTSAGDIPAYTRVDLRAAWQVGKKLELGLVGQNLADDRHPEFLSPDILSSEVPRSILVTVKVELD